MLQELADMLKFTSFFLENNYQYLFPVTDES